MSQVRSSKFLTTPACGRAILPPVFVGHFGVGLAAKTVAPRAPLGWLIAAPLLLDLLWPVFLLSGWESVAIDPSATVVTPFDFIDYPISHSLLSATGGGVLAAMIFWALFRYRTGVLSQNPNVPQVVLLEGFAVQVEPPWKATKWDASSTRNMLRHRGDVQFARLPLGLAHSQVPQREQLELCSSFGTLVRPAKAGMSSGEIGGDRGHSGDRGDRGTGRSGTLT